MKSRMGFSILECMVYCSLACLLCMLIFNWVGASRSALGSVQKKSRALLDTYGALDAFAHDAMGAPYDKDAWKIQAERELVWSSKEGDIGWVWRDGLLYRITGTYTHGLWTQATKSLVHNSLKRVQFFANHNKYDEVTHIVVRFDDFPSTIYLRSRRGHEAL